MNLQQLREKRNGVWESAKAFLDSHRTTNGTLSAEDDATYTKMEVEIEAYSKEIARLERAENLEKQLSMPVNTPIVTAPMGEKMEGKTGRASKEYKEGMLTALRTNFKQISNVLQEGVDTDGGYLVPVEYDKRLITALEDFNIMRSLATLIPTSGEHRINIAATKPTAAWIEEGEALSFSDATFDQVLLDAHKLHVAVKVTEELLYDESFGLENYLITKFAEALANAEEDAFLNGNGTGRPLGLFAQTGGGVVSDTVTTLSADAVLNVIYALKRVYRKNASFLINDQLIASVRKLKDSNGAYMWQPSLLAGEPDKLMGYPIHTSQFAPEDAFSFGDYRYYNIGDRGTRSFKQLTELFAGNGMIGYVAKERVDGKLILPEAVQIVKVAKAATTSTK
ncbi:MAG: phage major capsid protein [Eubacteriales bacterium]